MITPGLEEARRLALGHTRIPLSLEVFSDSETPIEVLKTLKAEGKNAWILESVESGESWGRYTFLGFDPAMRIALRDGVTRVTEGAETFVYREEPLSLLKTVVSRFVSPKMPNLPPFSGGFIGYFSYAYARYVEPTLKLSAKNALEIDDVCLMRFDKVIAFDHFRQKICLIVNIPSDALEENYAKGVATLQEMKAMLEKKEEYPLPPSQVVSEWTASFTKAGFCKAVETVKHHIVEGDIFQCVPSIRFSAAYQGSLVQAYRALRTINPSSYMFYIDFGDMEIAGASPETLISLKDGLLSTYPLAGTCKRHADEAKTEAAIAALLADEKELAEHDMLVDLSRNDLGKVSEFGSVTVPEYRKIKRCSHVVHISSKVVGRLSATSDRFDAIAAVIPAGTLSGAPKKRAMEIIDALETEARGVYGGAVGYIDFSGNMDLCIGIRMAVSKNGQVYAQAGAGVVADSIPENEYQECVNKAMAMRQAIEATKDFI